MVEISPDCFAIYPNPTAEILKLEMEESSLGQPAIICIHSKTGQLMARREVKAVDGAIETFLDKRRVPEVIPSGRASSSVTFTVTKGDLGPDGFVVRADDDGTGTGQQNECDERNNFEYYSESPC